MNGSISGSSTATAEQDAWATGTITHTTLSPGHPNSDPIEIPDLNPADFCGPPGYVYINGNLNAKLKQNLIDVYGQDRVFCINGNLQLTGDMTTEARASFIASGYITTSGSGFNHLKATHPDGFVLFAGGDIVMGGNGKFTGTIYARSQCQMPAAAEIYGAVPVHEQA